jgi:hypothetical protein
MAAEYMSLFVNRRAYARQSDRPGFNGRHNYYRPKRPDVWRWALHEAWRNHPVSEEWGNQDHRDRAKDVYKDRVKALGVSEFMALDLHQIEQHIAGHQTINLYAINPATQCCKWLAIDADYDNAFRDLAKLQVDLRESGVESALEMSRRGGHLWIFCETPLPARKCRLFIYNTALCLGVPIKGAGFDKEGIEIFPRHDELRDGELGLAIRGPLGIHRASSSRYWFYGGPSTLEGQLEYLRKLPKLTA